MTIAVDLGRKATKTNKKTVSYADPCLYVKGNYRLSFDFGLSFSFDISSNKCSSIFDSCRLCRVVMAAIVGVWISFK